MGSPVLQLLEELDFLGKVLELYVVIKYLRLESLEGDLEGAPAGKAGQLRQLDPRECALAEHFEHPQPLGGDIAVLGDEISQSGEALPCK